MNLTTFLKLRKPLAAEKYDINTVNYNTDLIDAAICDHENKLSTLDEKIATAENAADNKLALHINDSEAHLTAAERSKLENIEPGAQANTVLGIKGSKETDYRTGNVSLTPGDIGADAEGSADSALAAAKEYSDNTKISKTEIGAAYGIAPLGSTGRLLGENIPFGMAADMVMDGASGQLLADRITELGTELNCVAETISTLQDDLNGKAPADSPAFTGIPTAPTASSDNNTSQIATTAFVRTIVENAVGGGMAASDAMVFKGSLGTNGTITQLPTTYRTGWTYRVIEPGTYAGQVCENGDLVIAFVDRDGSDNEDSDWCIVPVTHKDVPRTDTSSAASPASGEAFTAVDIIVSDSKGHVTGVNTKTITIPAYGAATQTAPGLESAADKAKLDGIEAGAQVNVITGVKGNAETAYRTGNVNLTAENIGALPLSAKYAGSASAGGSATSAVKLDTSAGSATQPVYFQAGKPVACTYTLAKSVPSNAVFTDTNTWRGIQDNLTSASTSDSLSANQGRILKSLIDNIPLSTNTTMSEIGNLSYTTNSVTINLDSSKYTELVIAEFRNTSWHLCTIPKTFFFYVVETGKMIDCGEGTHIVKNSNTQIRVYHNSDQYLVRVYYKM